MKQLKNSYIVFILLFLCSVSVYGQKSSWFSDNVSIRKTFDGSKSENKPAILSLFENHKSKNDFFKADIAVKFIEWEIPMEKSTFILFPVVEWHKSSDEEDKKNKGVLGLNTEFYTGGEDIRLYVLSNIQFKRNFLDNVNEFKYVAQLSLDGDKKNSPGYPVRFDNEAKDYKGTYYPYIGFESHIIPDLINAGTTESFSNLLFRFFYERWLSPKSLQFIFNGYYRKLFGGTSLKKDLPFVNLSMNYYPGKQEKVSIGFDYKNGYDTESKYQLVEISSISLKVKF